MKRDNQTNRGKLANDIWRACDIMRRDNNCGGIMDYVEHLSWVLFLKFLDEQERAFEQEAAITGQPYQPIIDNKYRWSEWVPKAIGAKIVWITDDQRSASEWDAEALMRFVRGELLPYLSQLKGSPQREVIAGIFSNDRNIIVCASPYNLKDVLGIVDNINFLNTDDIHTVSHVYEDLLQKLGNENKMAGEFYTPRPVIRFMVKVIDPQINETVYDPACGSCGFLVEAFEHMRTQEQTTKDHQKLQEETFFGNEKKALPALLGTMNLILHGVLIPQVRRQNTLEKDIRKDEERFDVILTNPPFGGTENTQIQQNFPVKSNATELLFLEHIAKKLKPRDGARCGVVVPEGTLFRNGAFTQVKEELLHTFNLLMVVSLPPGTFAPYSDVKTALLFFERSGSTKEVLYYEMSLPPHLKKFSKGNLIADEHFSGAKEAWMQWKSYREGNASKPEPTRESWVESIDAIAKRGYDLSPKNPYMSEETSLPSFAELTTTLLERDNQFRSILQRLHDVAKSKEEVK